VTTKRTSEFKTRRDDETYIFCHYPYRVNALQCDVRCVVIQNIVDKVYADNTKKNNDDGSSSPHAPLVRAPCAMTRRARAHTTPWRVSACVALACAMIAARVPAHSVAVHHDTANASSAIDDALDALDAVSSAIANATNGDVGLNITDVLSSVMDVVNALDGEGDAARRVEAGDSSADAIRALEAEMRAVRDGMREPETNSSTSNVDSDNSTAAAAAADDDDTTDGSETGVEDEASNADDIEDDSGDIEAYLFDTSAVIERAISPKMVDPMIEGTYDTIGLVLADVGKAFGESAAALALGRLAQRLGSAMVRPGACACASGKACACDGACVVSETSVMDQIRVVGGVGNIAAIVSSAPRATWMSDVAKSDARWVGEVAHPVEFAFERLYRAAKHYILNGDDEFAPVPALLKCAAFTKALKPLRDKCASARCKTRFEDMRRYVDANAKRHIMSKCGGFIDNPQTKHLRGTTASFATETSISASRHTRAKYALLLPLRGANKTDVDDAANLVALSRAFGLKLSDLLVYVGPASRASADQDGYDVSKEPEDLILKLTSENRIDAKLYEDAQRQLLDEYADLTLQASRDALDAMLKAAALFCDEHKVCASGGRAAKDTLDIDAAHANVLGEFPASCGTREIAREVTCVRDWFACEGPGASGSMWYSSNGGDNMAPSSDATTTKCEPTKCEPTACVGATDDDQAVASGTARASEETARASEETASAVASAEASNEMMPDDTTPKPARKSVTDVTIKAAVNVHRQAPWMWYSMIFILIAVTLTSCAHARLVKSGPASSLELGASIVRDRPVSAKEIGREMSANDEFWQGGGSRASTSASPHASGRGTGRDSGNAGRRPSARGRVTRGPMTAEERAFYDEL